MSISRSVKKFCKYSLFFSLGFFTKCQLDANTIDYFTTYNLNQYKKTPFYFYESQKKEIKTQENQKKIILYRQKQSVDW